jgi:hypothetical protein
MEITVVAGFAAIGDMYIDAGHNLNRNSKVVDSGQT